MVKRNTVAVAVAAILAAAMRSGAAEAQSAANESTDGLQEVVVSGLRASLKDAMEIKRDAVGIVDAISAEDIGKFPDSNLSESLQRITGISISRRNGEGALVTARGFGSEFNMVTLNGRMMPAADAFGGGGNGFDGGVNGQNRSFNFANLASDSISGIEVYKTSKANIATGGIGATVNVLTARPLDGTSGWVANMGLKGVKDTINRVGQDINPEFNGLFSFTNDDRTFGVGLTGSYQKRNSGSSASTINDWNIRTWQPGAQTTQIAPGATIVNAPAAGSLYGIPNDIRYHFTDRERERINGQLTFQFKPMESMTVTADYTYAETELKEDRGDQTLWMNANRFNRLEFDTGAAVATPILLEEDEGTAKDFGFEQQHREQKNELKSPGLNVNWQLTDRFNLNFDVHDSKATSIPNDPVTGGGETLATVAVRLNRSCTPPDGDLCTNRVIQSFRFNDVGLPIAARTVFTQPTLTNQATSGGNSNFDFGLADVGSQYLRINYQSQETDITQARLDGTLDFDDAGRFQFGVETRAMRSHQLGSQGTMRLGDWGVNNPGEVPGGLVQAFSLVNQFEDFGVAGTPTVGFKGNATDLARWMASAYGVWNDPAQPNGSLGFNPNFNQDHVIKEDTDAVYVSYGLATELASKPAHLLVGVRYERTDVEATSRQGNTIALSWTDNNDFFRVPGTSVDTLQSSSDYKNVLPSLDFDMQLTDGLKARFGYSKSLARAQYNQLRSAIVIQDQGAVTGSTINNFRPLANASNPDLKPLESDNFDLSLEYYFGNSNYVSAGVFQKNVKNFIGNEVRTMSLFGIRDATGGPRALAAKAALEARGFPTDDTSLFTMTALIDNAAATGGAAAYNGSEAQALDIARRFDVLPNAQDPLYQFNVVTPVNNRDAKIKGAEIGGQYFFGDTGFGVFANYTIVDGDVAFDNAGDPNINQFALLGLSDSANAVLMYEKFGFSVRLAFNWRDEYLSNVNVGAFRNPVYVEPYQQFDLDIGYQFNEHLSVQFEGLNLTEEDVRWHGRTKSQVWFVEDQGARYAIGARYKF